MIAATLEYQIRDMFFDRQAVQDMADKNMQRGLRLTGARIRQRARRNIKTVAVTKKLSETARSTDKRKAKRAKATIRRRITKTSSPGAPPLSHVPSGEKISIRNILYAYEPSRKSVVAGPVKLNGTSGEYVAPEALEFGGTFSVFEASVRPGRWSRISKKKPPRWARGKRTRTRTLKMAPRPNMFPTLKEVTGEPSWPGLFD